MTIFVDASALIAIIAGEDDGDALTDVLETDRDRICSAVSVWETVAGLCRSFAFRIPDARATVQAFLDMAGVRMVAIGAPELELATEACDRYGKGRHPAALNMGDCFAYAAARANSATLLYKGAGFSKTDLSRG